MPDEVLLGICDQMEDKDLINFLQSSTRNYDVCSEIIFRRRKKKLALVLQETHSAMPLNIFELIIKDNTGLIDQTIQVIKQFKYQFYISNDYPYQDKFTPNLPQPSNLNSYLNKTYNDIRSLNSGELTFFKQVIDFLIQPTEYVIGLKEDGDLNTITVPYNSDARSIYLNQYPNFSSFLQHYIDAYKDTMIVKYLM